LRKTPPPLFAELPAIVTFCVSSVPCETKMPPPSELAPSTSVARFPLTVVLRSVAVPAATVMPPPMLPALVDATLFETVEPRIESSPLLAIPPPVCAWLPLTVTFTSVRLAGANVPRTRIPPPADDSCDCPPPFVIVTPEISLFIVETKTTRSTPLPEIFVTRAPAPTMVSPSGRSEPEAPST
jgi:hypothetical protein